MKAPACVGCCSCVALVAVHGGQAIRRVPKRAPLAPNDSWPSKYILVRNRRYLGVILNRPRNPIVQQQQSTLVVVVVLNPYAAPHGPVPSGPTARASGIL